jgi:hypothetical protein
MIAADCVFPEMRERRRWVCQITEVSQFAHRI